MEVEGGKINTTPNAKLKLDLQDTGCSGKWEMVEDWMGEARRNSPREKWVRKMVMAIV